jgi:hypothetical protein
LKYSVLSIQDEINNFIELHIGEGVLEWTEKRNVEFVKSRGELSFTRENDEEPVDVSFDFIWDFLISQSGQPVTIKEALTQTGAATTWTSSTQDSSQPYSVNIVIVYTPPCSGVEKETFVIQDFYYSEIAHDPKGASVSVKGQANIVRVASTRS